MQLSARPISADVSYQANFSEPFFEQAQPEGRLRLLKHLLTNFGLHLNDIKYNDSAASNNLLHFSKFLGNSFFDVSYGLEEVTALIRNPVSEEQIEATFKRLVAAFAGASLARQKMAMQQQFMIEQGESTRQGHLYLPAVPVQFNDHFRGGGATFFLKYAENDMTFHITIADSLILEHGIFFSCEWEFLPNKYSFEDAYAIVIKHYRNALAVFGITLVQG